MKHTTVEEEECQISFARAAAEHFAKNPQSTSFGNGFPAPGALLALRWGLSDDCVLVVKLSDTHVPTNYGQAIRDVPGYTKCATS